MRFDARAAKLLAPGGHMIVEGCPGLRLVATASKRTWTYRFKSPVDGRMRQIALGTWPAMGLAAAAGAWEAMRQQRRAGADPAMAKKETRKQAAEPPRRGKVYTVGALAADYLAGHIKQRRKPKGRAEVQRLFERLLVPISNQPAEALTRRMAFEFLENLADTPVQAMYLRQELAGAWDYALDAGRA